MNTYIGGIGVRKVALSLNKLLKIVALMTSSPNIIILKTTVTIKPGYPYIDILSCFTLYRDRNMDDAS